jgi:hypothetical protein
MQHALHCRVLAAGVLLAASSVAWPQAAPAPNAAVSAARLAADTPQVTRAATASSLLPAGRSSPRPAS